MLWLKLSVRRSFNYLLPSTGGSAETRTHCRNINYGTLVTHNRSPEFFVSRAGQAHDAFAATSMGLIPRLSRISEAAPLSFNSRIIETSPLLAA